MARKDPKFCQEVREKIRKWGDYWKYNNDQFHEYMLFVMGSQWRDDEAKVLQDYKKVPLTFNKLGTLANHLVGEQRQNTPNLQIFPDDNVPEQTAEVRAALIKEISLNSDSKVVYQTAFQNAVIGGFGAFRIGTEYENDYSFDQEIRLYPIKDPTRAYWDISAESPCKTDGMHAGFQIRMSRQKFKDLYGSRIERTIPTSSEDDSRLAFADDDSVTVIYHYERKYDTKTIYLIYDMNGNSQIIDEDEFKNVEVQDGDDEKTYIYQGREIFIRDKRESPHYKIKYYLIGGDYVLDESDFPSKQLPIPFVDQNSYFDEKGKQICRPFFKDAKDAQRFINYIGTLSAYIMKVSRYDQFMVPKTNVRGEDTQLAWRDPATYLGGLFYDESPNGSKPERLAPPELPQTFVTQYQRALNDIQTCTGMYDTQVGEQGNELSGAAIDARTERGSYNTFVAFDSLNRAIACAGQIIDEMIPSIYDTERTLMLNMPDTGMKPVGINQSIDPYGSGKVNDMTAGRYRIRLLPGASTENQKTQLLQSMQMILQNSPDLFRLIGDLYVENLPAPNTIELKNRIRTIIPPEIIQAGKTGQPLPPQQNQPSPEQQAALMTAQAKMADVQNKQAELQMKMRQSQMEFAQEQQRLQAEQAEVAGQLQEQVLRYASETHRTNTDAQMNHSNNLVKILTHQPKHLTQ